MNTGNSKPRRGGLGLCRVGQVALDSHVRLVSLVASPSLGLGRAQGMIRVAEEVAPGLLSRDQLGSADADVHDDLRLAGTEATRELLDDAFRQGTGLENRRIEQEDRELVAP